MSYVRWSGPNGPHPYDSAIYIYDSYRGGLTCCGCTLQEPVTEEIQYGTWTEHPDYHAETHEQMIKHVRDHQQAGHAVPDFVIPSLAEAERESQ